MSEPIFMKPGVYITALESTSTTYFIFGLWAYICTALSLLGNGSVKTLPRHRIHKQRENCWTRRLLCGPCRIKESRQLVLVSKFLQFESKLAKAFCINFKFISMEGHLQLLVHTFISRCLLHTDLDINALQFRRNIHECVWFIKFFQ
jgi:hypothetical protein